MSITLDHLQAALQSLTRHGSIKDRLTEAYRNHLALVDEEDLPTELREEFQLVMQTLTRERPLLRGEDAVRATVRKMSSHEAAEVAYSVVRMFAAVSRTTVSSACSKILKGVSNVVPLHVAEA
ncbi:MAG TPA: hypothetical protein VGL55_16970 [Steroidobacteraceae bacterium]|jgi:hypothetical protein